MFGLAFSKLITLGLVPAMLALPYRIREKRAARKARRAQRASAMPGLTYPRSDEPPYDQAAE